jgi:hypothetical protein
MLWLYNCNKVHQLRPKRLIYNNVADQTSRFLEKSLIVKVILFEPGSIKQNDITGAIPVVTVHML